MKPASGRASDGARARGAVLLIRSVHLDQLATRGPRTGLIAVKTAGRAWKNQPAARAGATRGRRGAYWPFMRAVTVVPLETNSDVMKKRTRRFG
jgi:hypothetical protein